MPGYRWPIDSYMVFYYCGQTTEAAINIYEGTNYRGQINFMKDGTTLPANRFESERPILHFPLSRFADLLTILREEKPLVLGFNTDSKVGAIYSATWEPIGEDEGP